MAPLVTLLTDFGTNDSFVGEMKGVISSICPGVAVVDLTHAIPSHDIHQAAFTWKVATDSFPKGSIHVGVVDPGVGTERRVLVAEIDGSCYICPDNGMLSWILADAASASIVAATRPEYWRQPVSRTFHGRDIFAPIAAHLACGVPMQSVGQEIGVKEVVRSRVSKPRLEGNKITGRPMLADRFGNILTNLPNELLELASGLSFGGRPCKPVRSFAEGGPGELLVLKGSHGYLEIAFNKASVLKEIPGAMAGSLELTLKSNAT